MRIGHLLYQPTPDMSYSHTKRLHETIELTQLAEELKFDLVAFTENHFSNYSYSANPVLLAAAIGQHTSTIDMGTGVAVLPFWNPLRLAEDIAIADQLLGGRFEVCVGRGYQHLEFRGLGIPYDERQERYTEALDILLGAWTSTSLEYFGKHYTVSPPVNVLPKPFQRPHPRIVVSAVTDESIRSAAATDFRVFGRSWDTEKETKSGHEKYLEERARLGRPGDYWTNGMNRQIFVVDATAPTEYAAERREALLRSLEATRLGEGLRRGTAGYDQGRIISHPIPGEPSLEDHMKHMIFGNPGEVLEQVRVLRDRVGVQAINIMTEFGGVDHAKARRSIELFGREVLPALREDEANASQGVAGSPAGARPRGAPVRTVRPGRAGADSPVPPTVPGRQVPGSGREGAR